MFSLHSRNICKYPWAGFVFVLSARTIPTFAQRLVLHAADRGLCCEHRAVLGDPGSRRFKDYRDLRRPTLPTI